MFSVHCPRHGHEVLLGHRQILGIAGRAGLGVVHALVTAPAHPAHGQVGAPA